MKMTRGILLAVIVLFMCHEIIESGPKKERELPNNAALQSLFTDFKITWTKDLSDSVVSFRATEKCLAISAGSGNEKNLYFIDFEKGSEWSLSNREYPNYYFEIVGEENPKLMIACARQESDLETNLFDRSGKHLFTLRNRSKIEASPGGKYFYVGPNQASRVNLAVYNYEGKFLWAAQTSRGDWEVKALSDSELIYVDGTSLILYDLDSGRQIWKTHSPPIRGYSPIVCSKHGKDFLIIETDEIFSFNYSGKLKWSRNDLGYVYSAAISENGDFVAVHSSEIADKPPSRLILLDNKGNGKTIWSQVINEASTRNNIGSVWFSGDNILLMPQAVEFYYISGLTGTIRTYVYRIDELEGKLISSFIVPGGINISEKNRTTGYCLMEISGKKTISRVQENK